MARKPKMPSPAVMLQQHRKLPRFVRLIRARPRLVVAALIGLVIVAALPTTWWLTTRLLLGWDIGIALYLVAILQVVAKADAAHIRHRAAIEDEGQLGVLLLTVAAAVASIGAIVVLLASKGANGRDSFQLALAIATIVLSWGFIHTIFAFHYAHDFYGDRATSKGGLLFPNTENPNYWDFLYFSFIIGMTSQVSDVAISSQMIRRTATAHGIVSFLYNVALVSLMVNIAASAI
jgi:uncharacterized membrane protein